MGNMWKNDEIVGVGGTTFATETVCLFGLEFLLSSINGKSMVTYKVKETYVDEKKRVE